MPKTSMDDIKPLSDAIQVHRNQYSSGGADYSVTTLIKPPRIVFLEKRHLASVDLYVEDLLKSFTGTAAHNYIEMCLNKIPNSPYECETRLSHTVSDRLISGAFDMARDTDVLYDLKTTGVWKVMMGSKDDWSAQQNIYRWLYWKKRGIKLNKLQIVGVFGDWKLRDKQRIGRNYPPQPAVEYTLPVWDLDETYSFMVDRVNLLKAHEQTPDDELPPCSYDDMWSEPDKVAVMSSRIPTKAVRVLSDMKTAKAFVSKYLENPDCKDSVATLRYEVRLAARKRCDNASFCPVRNYCSQYHEYLKTKAMLMSERSN